MTHTDDNSDVHEQPMSATGRRRRAIEEAVRGSAGPTPRCPGVAVRRYDDDCLVLAVSGVFDEAARARLDAVARDLSRIATAELVLVTSRLTACDRRLARLLSRIRLRHLMEGARVELHDPPLELTAELGQAPVTQFSISDRDQRTRPSR